MSRGGLIILIAGELGSGTTDVGKAVGQSMGLPVFNTEAFLRTAAVDLKASFEKLASMEKSGEINLEAMLRGMVQDQVTAGNAVIEGRAAMLVLDKEVTLKVFLNREKQGRVALVASGRGIPIQEARAEVEFSDRERSDRARSLFGIDWTDLSQYDLSISTSKFTHAQAAELVVSALEAKGALQV